MNDWFEILIGLSVAGSTVVICILSLNQIMQKNFLAKCNYLIRKLAIFFFLVPVWFIVQKLTFLLTESNRIITILKAGYWEEIIPQQYLSIELPISILSIWGVGFVIFGGWHVYSYVKFSKEIKRSNIPFVVDNEVYQLLAIHKEKMRIRSNIRLVYNDKISSPALFGLLRPTIFLPNRKISSVELNMVLHHELIHFKRKDLWMKMFMLIASSLHWFNPFVHILRKEVHIWSELSCDEEVVTDMPYAERKQYGEMILNLLEDSFTIPTLYSSLLSGNKNILKQRLTMLLEVKPMKKFVVAMAATIIISVGAIGITVSALALESPLTIDSDKTKQTIFNPNDQKVEEVNTD